MNQKIVAKNPTARHNYTIEDTIEAGIVLTGTEIKSIRNGKAIKTFDTKDILDNINFLKEKGITIPKEISIMEKLKEKGITVELTDLI